MSHTGGRPLRFERHSSPLWFMPASHCGAQGAGGRTCERPPIVHPAALPAGWLRAHGTLPDEFATARTRPRADLLRRDDGMDATEGALLSQRRIVPV
jgi:hypothetical protein